MSRFDGLWPHDKIELHLEGELTDYGAQKVHELLGMTTHANPQPVPTAAEIMQAIRGVPDLPKEILFLALHPDDWPEVKASIVQRGLAVFEDEKTGRIYVGGTCWRHAIQGEDGSETEVLEYTGTPIHLVSEMERGKMLKANRPPDDFWRLRL